MSWTVLSDRLPWPAGTVVDIDMLTGCNIEALVVAGHLSPALTPTTPAPPAASTAEKPEE